MVGSHLSTSSQESQKSDSDYAECAPHASSYKKTKKMKDPDELEGYKMYNGSYTRDLGNNEGDSSSRETDNSFANSSPPSSVSRTTKERNGIPSPANPRFKDDKASNMDTSENS
ncbi:uncharacterized protein LOC134264815 [Saccostrea cucullata]|uniref:uncharacterized protein LOC134264815 n=1 Tax=Saccostrea cuccullata TaxID=36930 RepID=UPI002ED07711